MWPYHVHVWLIADIQRAAQLRPLYPQERTFGPRDLDSDLRMSALPPKADIHGERKAAQVSRLSLDDRKRSLVLKLVFDALAHSAEHWRSANTPRHRLLTAGVAGWR